MVRAITLLGIATLLSWAESGPIREMSSSLGVMDTAVPAFYNAYLYSCEPRNVVTLFAPDGHLISSLSIEGHGNGKANALSVAIDSDGVLAIAWGDAMSAGIDIRDSSGSLLRTIDTGRYIPAHLSFGGDHSLWGFGWQRDVAKPSNSDRRDYATVRKYSIDGKEMGAYLPRSLFAPGLEPGTDGWQQRRITVTDDRVGIEAFSGNLSNQREWVELDLKGNLTGRWKLDPRDEFPRVVLTSDNHAYVQRYDPKAKVRRVFVLNRASSTWDLVDSPNALLYGADGRNLVFAQWTDGVMRMSWYSQPQISALASTISN